MRVLVLSQYFWPESFRVNDLVQALRERGHDITVLTGLPNYPGGRLFEGYSWWRKRHDRFSDISVFRVPIFLRRQGKGWQLALNYVSFVVSACLLAPWLLRDRKIDVIFVFAPSPFTVGIPAVLLRVLKRAPMLFWVQDLWPESLEVAGIVRTPAILKSVGAMVRWVYRRCDLVLLQSLGFTEPAISAGAIPERIRYFPNWAESFYQPQSFSPEFVGNLPSGFRLMFAGNLGEAQSLGTVLDAAESLRDERSIQWLIVGDGRRSEWLCQQIVKRGLGQSVHLLGSYPPEQMPVFFAAADALLVTLKRAPIFASTIPSKLQTYLACGRPILGALDGEGARIIKESGVGYAAPAEDGEQLASAVLRLFRLNAAERQQMGRQGRIYYERHFARERLIDDLETWFAQAVREQAR